MKKLTYLISILFMVALMTTSCEKDDPIDPTNPDGGHITLAQLNGTWEFQKYIYNGVEYTADNALSGMSSILMPYTFMVSTMTFKGSSATIYNFTKDGNKIIVYDTDGTDKRFEFTVDSFVGNVLNLKLDFVPEMWSFKDIGGTLVLEK